MIISGYLPRGPWRIRAKIWIPRLCCVLSGLCLSAASLGNSPMPIAMGLVCALPGRQAALTALGGSLGYLLFWGQAGYQGLLWLGMGLVCALQLGQRPILRRAPLLLPALGVLFPAASGLLFQILLNDGTAIPVYLLRVALGGSAVLIFQTFFRNRGGIPAWLAAGLFVLALAQIQLFPFLSLGFLAAAAIAAVGAFPAAALAGLALDLAAVTAMPMTAVTSLSFFIRWVPGLPRWTELLAPSLAYTGVSLLTGHADWEALPALLLGGFLGALLPNPPKNIHRRGETGVAQVRLELAAGVFGEAALLLLEAEEPEIDEEALIAKAAASACNSCPCRKSCRERTAVPTLPPQILHRPLMTPEQLPITCRKPGRLLTELRRSQERLRTIRGNRDCRRECREAVLQQYRFLENYLQNLSDNLSRRGRRPVPRFRAEVAVCANRPAQENGDRCLWFSGTECRYYVLLCDGMGTGPGAVQEGRTAGQLLKRLLGAGLPPEYALRSVNSLCALRGRAGAVTVDLVELHLDTGKGRIYKWGAAPSYLFRRGIPEKIGTAGPPPGLSVMDQGEESHGLSLGRGELLALLSDGVGGEDAHLPPGMAPGATPGEAAAKILELACGEEGDDATVAVIRLVSPSAVT